MKKNFLFGILIAFSYNLKAQTVETYAGKANDDYTTKYESTSAVALKSTFFTLPSATCFDPSGKMYISENNKIRIVLGDKVYIRAGSLQQPSFSEGYKNGTGTQSTFRNPGGMVTDASGNLYVADVENHCIRKITKYINVGNGQTISTFAGAAPTPGLPGYGTSGSTNGTGTAARFNKPKDIAIDGDGNFYVTEYDNFTIRKITPSGVVTTLAGKAGVEGTTDGTTGATARFGGPWGVAMLNSNHIVVTDQWNTCIRKINIYSGVTTTIAGSTSGSDPRQVDGTLAASRFYSPKGITVIGGIIYVTDRNTIRAIDVANNSVTTFAGNKTSFKITDGVGSAAEFTEMSDIQSDGSGNMFVTENSTLVASSVIRKVTINNLAPSANFSTSGQTLVTNISTTLEDISGGQEATTRTWLITPLTYTITSGDLSSKTMDLNFQEAGFYTVKLDIINDYGSDSKRTENYFTVSTTGGITQYTNSNLVKVYPNPANQSVQVRLDPSLNTTNTTITLFTINGQKLSELNANEIISTTALPNGTYFITVANEEVSFAKKLIINH